jgi:hypothetical protein
MERIERELEGQEEKRKDKRGSKRETDGGRSPFPF